MKLLTSQKDEIFEIIKYFDGFSPSQFELREFSQNRTVTINYSNSKYFFQLVYNSQGNAHLNFSPGNEKFQETTGLLTWNRILDEFESWLRNLKREITTPDYWGNLKKQISGITFLNQIDNEKFTYVEYEDLKMRIEGLKSRLDSLPLIQEQQTEIINHLDKLSEQAKELGKFDWRNLFVGTMLAIFIQLGVSPENISALWELIKSTFNNYFLE